MRYVLLLIVPLIINILIAVTVQFIWNQVIVRLTGVDEINLIVAWVIGLVIYWLVGRNVTIRQN